MIKDLDHLKTDSKDGENFELLWNFDPIYDVTKKALIVITPWTEEEWAKQLKGAQGLEQMMLAIIKGLVDHVAGVPEVITADRSVDPSLQRSEDEIFKVNWHFDRLGRKRELLIISTPWNESRFQELRGADPEGKHLMLRVLRATVNTNRSWIDRSMYGFPSRS